MKEGVCQWHISTGWCRGAKSTPGVAWSNGVLLMFWWLHHQSFGQETTQSPMSAWDAGRIKFPKEKELWSQIQKKGKICAPKMFYKTTLWNAWIKAGRWQGNFVTQLICFLNRDRGFTCRYTKLLHSHFLKDGNSKTGGGEVGGREMGQHWVISSRLWNRFGWIVFLDNMQRRVTRAAMPKHSSFVDALELDLNKWAGCFRQYRWHFFMFDWAGVSSQKAIRAFWAPFETIQSGTEFLWALRCSEMLVMYSGAFGLFVPFNKLPHPSF